MFPKIMGILNATPDSFSDGTGSINPKLLYLKARQMINDGADIIDIGGETTKPGATDIPANVELARVIPTLKLIRKNYPNAIISVDTRKATVAEEALKHGAHIINDVSGLQYDPNMATTIAKYNASIVIMHCQKTPATMQIAPYYENVTSEVFDFLQQKITMAQNAGIELNKIIADIGIGFGKTTTHNLTLIKNIDYFANLNVPLLLGISRKNFIGDITSIAKPKSRDTATMLLHAMLLKNQTVNIIRIHNVKLAKQLKIIYNKINT